MPSILVVATDGARRAALVDALERRFGADYDVVARSTGDDVGPEIGPLAVALAPIDAEGLAALRVVGATHLAAKRIAVVEVGDRSVSGELAKATTLGQVDHYVGHPLASPEEELYPVITEALRIWSYDQRLRLAKLTIVDESVHGLGATLASLLEQNSVAVVQHLAHSPEGQALLDGPLAGLPLLALRFWDGLVLGAPTESGMVKGLGVPTHPAGDHLRRSRRGRRAGGLAASVYASSEGLRTLIEKAAVGGQAGTNSKVRTTSASRGVSAAATSRSKHIARPNNSAPRSSPPDRRSDSPPKATCCSCVSSGDVVRTRSVILTGAISYRRTGMPSVDALIGRGVRYGAAAGEATSMGGFG